MSRVGKYPVIVPAGVTVSVDDSSIVTKGKNGEKSLPIMESVTVVLDGNLIMVTPKRNSRNIVSKRSRQAWGTMRSLIQNAVTGVSEGFVKRMEVNGVGYRAQVQGNILKMNLGFSHEVNFAVPADVRIVVEGDRGQTVLAVHGADNQRVGQVASEIRSWRRPEPYKGKGIRYVGEQILRKEGKKK